MVIYLAEEKERRFCKVEDDLEFASFKEMLSRLKAASAFRIPVQYGRKRLGEALSVERGFQSRSDSSCKRCRKVSEKAMNHLTRSLLGIGALLTTRRSHMLSHQTRSGKFKQTSFFSFSSVDKKLTNALSSAENPCLQTALLVTCKQSDVNMTFTLAKTNPYTIDFDDIERLQDTRYGLGYSDTWGIALRRASSRFLGSQVICRANEDGFKVKRIHCSALIDLGCWIFGM